MAEHSVRDSIAEVQEKIAKAALASGRNPEDIHLVAASKTQSSETIRAAIASGIAICGENRVQEMQEHLAVGAYEGARLDFIGHLQRNKVRFVVGEVDLIQSVSSMALLEEVSKVASGKNLSQNILLQVNLVKEESKGGFFVEELDEICHKAVESSGINLQGFMAIPPIMDSPLEQEKFFARLFQLYLDFSQKMSHNYNEFTCLSMGMSGDYELAIQQGSTMVRVGTALFGSRDI